MPRTYKRHDGTKWTDPRDDVHEWSRKIGGRFGHLLELEVRVPAPEAEQTLWARVRNATEWDGLWFQVPDDVLVALPWLRQYHKSEIGAKANILGVKEKIRPGQKKRAASRLGRDRREYI